MSPYQFVLFVHVVGAVGMFVALGIEGVAVARLHAADTTEQVAGWLGVLKLSGRLGPAAMVGALAAGGALMAMGWAPQPWIAGGIVGVAAMMAVGGVVSVRGLRRLRAAFAAETGPQTSDRFRSLSSRRGLTISLRVRIALGFGILALMTLRPETLLGSVLTLWVAVFAGLLSSVRIGSRAAARKTYG